jgi:plastocyanin
VLPLPSDAKEVDVPVYLHEFQGSLHMVPSTVEANVGDKIVFTVTNQGIDHDNSPHNFIVCGDGTNPSSDCNDKWAFSGMIQDNQTVVVTVPSVPKAGTFDYFCSIPGHKQAGMTGQLVVQGSGPTQKSSPGTATIGTLMALGAVALFARKVR